MAQIETAIFGPGDVAEHALRIEDRLDLHLEADRRRAIGEDGDRRQQEGKADCAETSGPTATPRSSHVVLMPS